MRNLVSRSHQSPVRCLVRGLASHSPHFSSQGHKVVVVGGGSAGSTIAHQLLLSGRFKQGDISVIEPSKWHNYQPGWTLVGAGVKEKEHLRQPIDSILDSRIAHYSDEVTSFFPDENKVELQDGRRLSYEHLVVVPGIELKISKIKGLHEALSDPNRPVATIYSYDSCSKVYDIIRNFQSGRAIFTQPAGVLKCAGGPQKIMWLALDLWKKAGLYSPHNQDSKINISFATGLDKMFGVLRYSETLEALRKERGVEGFFSSDLCSIDGNTATFKQGKDKFTKMDFDMLHVVPPMGPYDFVASSLLADAAGLVEVDPGTLQHLRYSNIWSAGDASSLPTSKTAAAITKQAPVLVQNLLAASQGKPLPAVYDGYTSCPIPTEYGKLLLAEFKYQGEAAETFSSIFNQTQPQRPFYYLKKDFFPWVYFQYMVHGKWAGPSGFLQ